MRGPSLQVVQVTSSSHRTFTAQDHFGALIHGNSSAKLFSRLAKITEHSDIFGQGVFATGQRPLKPRARKVEFSNGSKFYSFGCWPIRFGICFVPWPSLRRCAAI